MKSLLNSGIARAGASIALAAAALMGGAAHAAGTPSGTSIGNLATLAYTVGGTVQTPIGSSAAGNTSGTGTATSFLVDNKVNLLVTTSDAAYVAVVPGLSIASATASQVATFVVTNTGNTTQDFALTSLSNYTALTANVFGGSVTDNFDPSACSIKVGTAVTPTYGGATTGTYIDELAPDATRTVYVVCAIPLAQIDGDIAAISLTAEARTGGTTGSVGAALTQTTGADTAGVDIVFADSAGTDDLVRDAKSSARDAFKIVSAKLTVTKTVAPVCDPFNGNALNGAKNIPGSYVGYTISIANTGAASATLGTITDTLVSTLTLDPDLIAIDQALTASSANSATTAAACAAVGSGGVATSAAGNNVKVVQSNRLISSYRTSSTGDSDGVGLVGTLLTIDFGTVLPLVTGTYTAGELKANETVSVTFQAKIN
jgi:hypothetical protein